MNPAVEVVDLVKRYPKSPRPAVDKLSFTVSRGEVFGLLGPNGAGKTTTVGILTTRVRKTAGVAKVSGVDVSEHPVEARRKVAVVPQRVNLDRSLTVRRNLLFHASYHGVGRAERTELAEELLTRMGLADKADARIDELSGGQSQRLMIARALMHKPEVLFLDEPSTGLDPQARLFVHDRIADLRSDGVTILITTHDMDEAAKLSDRVGIVDHGKLLALDTPAGLTRSLPGKSTIEATIRNDSAPPDKLVEVLSEIRGVHRVERLDARPAGDGNGFGGGGWPGANGAPAVAEDGPDQFRARLYVDADPATLLGPAIAALGEHGATVTDLSLGEPSLEDVFIHLTGRELR